MVDTIFCDKFNNYEQKHDSNIHWNSEDASDKDYISKYFNNGVKCPDQSDPSRINRYSRPALVQFRIANVA